MEEGRNRRTVGVDSGRYETGVPAAGFGRDGLPRAGSGVREQAAAEGGFSEDEARCAGSALAASEALREGSAGGAHPDAGGCRPIDGDLAEWAVARPANGNLAGADLHGPEVISTVTNFETEP